VRTWILAARQIGITIALLTGGIAHADVEKTTLKCHVTYTKRYPSKPEQSGTSDIKVEITRGTAGGPEFQIKAFSEYSTPILVWMAVGGSEIPKGKEFGISSEQSDDRTWRIHRAASTQTEDVAIDRVNGTIDYRYEITDKGKTTQVANFTGNCDKVPPPNQKF